MSERSPLILITNDDGINSPGLRAAVQAVCDLGELLIVAPQEQQSGMGRSLPGGKHINVLTHTLSIDEREFPAYSVSGSPAQAVLYAIMALAHGRMPDLTISGVNFGENLGNGIMISGTVGAALQSAAMGTPALAVSLESPKSMHWVHSYDELVHSLDWRAAQHITRKVAEQVLRQPLPHEVEVFKIDVPSEATVETPWRLTMQSVQSYYSAVRPADESAVAPPTIDYTVQIDPARLEHNSDIYVFLYDRAISVTPLSLNLTSRTDFAALDARLRNSSSL